MRVRDGFWELDVPLASGASLYVFEVEGLHRVVDPESVEIEVQDGVLWSVRRAGPGSAS